MKKVKKIRMIEFIDTLDKSDKIILDKEKDIILIDYSIYECHDDSASGPETESDSNTNDAEAKDTTDTDNNSGRTSSDSDRDPDKDPYEPRKKKSRIDNNYTHLPAGHTKDKDDYYNTGICTVSATAATATAAKYLIEDSGSNSADTTDTADTTDSADSADRYELDKELDASIRNIIERIIYDKNKDD
jgi:hypothetical protein